MLPEPECRGGYTRSQLEEILEDRLAEFDKWMYGQTQLLCNGLKWNREAETYELEGDGTPHGVVTYPWDLERFLANLPVID